MEMGRRERDFPIDIMETENKTNKVLDYGSEMIPDLLDKPATVTGEKNEKKTREEMDSIQRQIKDLVRRKKEIRKNKTTLDKDVSNRNTWNKEKRLPQRTPRAKPKIISNVQLIPPRDGTTSIGGGVKSLDNRDLGEDSNIEGSTGLDGSEDNRNWRNVTIGKRRDRIRTGRVNTNPQMVQRETQHRNQVQTKDKYTPGIPRRAPRSSAVMIVCSGEEFSYADALKKARSKISLEDLRIERTKIRRAVNGGILIKVMDRDGQDKAGALAEQLRVVLHEETRVTRPIVKSEIRLVGLDDSVSVEEVTSAIARIGECSEINIKFGTLRPMRNGLFSIWAKCLSAAIEIANYGKIRLGWTYVRVDLLEARPTQCYKCWRFGHLKNSCTSKEDYSKACFKCGGKDHIASMFNFPPKCKICTEDGKEADHRLGSLQCTAERTRRNIGSRTFYRTPRKEKPAQQEDSERETGNVNPVDDA